MKNKKQIIINIVIAIVFFFLGGVVGSRAEYSRLTSVNNMNVTNTKEQKQKEEIKPTIKEENENVQKTDLKNSKIYEEMSTLMPFEITEISSTISNNNKSLYVEFNVKKGSIKDEINEFYTDCTLISSYISTRAEGENFKYLIIINKELGAVVTYVPNEQLNGFFTLQSASFSNEENQKLFDEISKGK